MDERDLRQDIPRQRRHVLAAIASLFASLLLLLGADASGRYNPGLSNLGAMSRSDSGQLAVRAVGDTRFLTASEQSSRPKLSHSGSGDGCISSEIETLRICRHGDLLQSFGKDRSSEPLPLPYWSRAPPMIQHIA